MCGRFSLHHPTDEIHEHFNIVRPVFLVEPRYNIAPTQPIAVVTPARALVRMRWGLVPRWSKDGKPFINARGESLAEKPSFRNAFRERRVIVPLSGFYEWRVDGKLRVPLYFRLRDRAPIGVAAIWEPSADPRGPAGVALITVAANDVVRPVHDRMPAFLPRENEAAWLDPGSDHPEALLRSFPADAMESFTVSSRVNGVKEDDPSLIEPQRHGLFG